jgi:1,2-phenylacetyl-CoA epoxidase PaaB subunit
MYVTTNTFNNEISEPILVETSASLYEQIQRKRFELAETDGQGFTFMQKNEIDDTWIIRTAWASAITPSTTADFSSEYSVWSTEFANSTTYQSQRRAWNTQEAAEAYVDFINQLASPVWSATYDGFDDSIQNDGSSLLA